MLGFPLRRSALRCLVAGALLPLHAFGQVVAQERAQEPAPEEPPVAEETFYEAIQVRVAEVEVVVTDREGKPVTGLTREDFTLYVDGERVELTAFAAYAPAPAGSPRSGGSDENQAADAAETTESAAPPQVVARVVERPASSAFVALLLDNQSLTVQGRKRLLEDARTLVRRLGPGQEIAVAVQDSPGALRIVQAPTSDHVTALAALERAAAPVPSGNATYNDTQRLIRALELAPLPGNDRGMAAAGADDLYQQIRHLAQQLEAQALSTAGAIEQLVQAVAGLPGRKAVVLLSGGIPQRPGEALVAAWRNRFAGSPDVSSLSSPLDGLRGDVSSVLARTAAHANGSGVAIYALAAPAVPSRLSAETLAIDVWTDNEEWTTTMNVRDSLQQLALPTGGVLGLDNGAKVVVDTLRSDLESYYSLGYTPRERRRGKDRKLRVEVARPGLRARHRSAHRERTSGELMAEQTRAALLFGFQDNPLGVAVEVGAPVKGERRGTSELPLTIMLPLSQVVLVPQGPVHEGRLTIHVAAVDEEGRSSPVSSVEVPVRVPNEQLLTALSQQLAYRTRLAVRTARQKIAVSVRDELGHQSSTVRVEHAPDAAPATPAAERAPAAAPPPVGGQG